MTPTSVFSRRRQAFLFSLYRSKSMNAVYFGNLLQTSFNFFLDFTEVEARMPPTSVFSYRRHSISSWTLPKWEQECRLLRYSLADGRQFLLGLYRSGSKNDGYFGIFLQTAGFFFSCITEVNARMTLTSVICSSRVRRPCLHGHLTRQSKFESLLSNFHKET